MAEQPYYKQDTFGKTKTIFESLTNLMTNKKAEIVAEQERSNKKIIQQKVKMLKLKTDNLASMLQLLQKEDPQNQNKGCHEIQLQTLTELWEDWKKHYSR